MDLSDLDVFLRTVQHGSTLLLCHFFFPLKELFGKIQSSPSHPHADGKSGKVS